jgi:hypothetical protein
MNSIQIDRILRKIDCYRGVYSSNNIQRFQNYPYALVANTDKMGEMGTHWVGMYVPNSNTIEYFDSFAEPPNPDIEKFLNQFKHIKMNTKKLQSIFDNSCGSHVIYFLVNRCRGEKFDSIVHNLSNSYSDAFVKLFVYNLVKTI